MKKIQEKDGGTTTVSERSERESTPPVIEPLHCYRCGADWYPRVPGKMPTVCARCKNPRWSIPRPVDETESITPAEQRAIDAYLQVLRAGGPRIKAIRALIELEASSPGSAVRVLEKVTR